MIDVTLTRDELRVATWFGKMRHANAVNGGFSNNRFNGVMSLDAHIEGARAESAFAKHFNLYWPFGNAEDGMGKPDFLGYIDVKHTKVPSNKAHLMVQKRNLKPFVYVLVCGVDGFYTIAGWHDARLPQVFRIDYFEEPAIMIPVPDLQPVDTLQNEFILKAGAK